jgi:hypothetical protein
MFKEILMKRIILLGLLLPIIGLISGCSLEPTVYTTDYETINRLKNISMDKVAIGDVQPKDPTASVNKISLRAATLAPKRGSFATYLEDALRNDLRGLGIYDASSTTQINVIILKNDIDISGFNIGNGLMEIKLTVNKNGLLKLDKKYSAKTEFESSFAGAVAITNGQNEYPKLVKTLLKNIYTDSDFINILKK